MPDILPYSAWEKPSEDKLTNLRSYADYVRGEHFKEGNLQSYESEIQQGILDRAVMDGLIDPDAPEDDPDKKDTLDALYGPQADSQESDLKFLLDQYYNDGDDERAGAIRRYLAATKVDYAEGADAALQEITPFATKENINAAKKAAVDRGELPFVAVDEVDEKGNVFRDIYAGDTDPPTPEELPLLLDQLKQKGAVQGSDLALLEYKLGKDPATGSPRYKVERQRDFMNGMTSVLEDDSELGQLLNEVVQTESGRYSFKNDAEWFQATKGTGLAMLGGLQVAATMVGSTGQTLMQGARGEGFEFGRNFDQNLAKFGPNNGRGLDGTIGGIVEKLAASPLGEKFSTPEIETFVNDFVKLNMRPKFDSDEPERNFIRLSTGGLVAHNALLGNAAKHDTQVDALNIGEDQKRALKESRRTRLQGIATDHRKNIIKLFGADAVDQFDAIKAKGGSDADFVESFLSDEKNYNHFNNSLQYLGISTADALVSGIAGLTMMGAMITEEAGKTVSAYGAEEVGGAIQGASVGTIGVAKDVIGFMFEQKARQKEQADLFGQEFGLFTEVAAVIPQVAVDLLATRGIMVATRGAAKGISKAVSKTAARTGVRNIAKSAMANSLSQRTRAMLTETATGRFVHKTSSIAKSVADDLLGESIPIAIPAFSRSYGASYTSIYNQLPDSMSAEEKHQKANAFAIGSGINTAAMTLAFGKLGAAGVEAMVMKGFSWRQMKTLYDDALNAGRVSTDIAFKNAVKQSYRGALRHIVTKGFKHPFGEGLEEGIDEHVQSMIEGAALDQDRPFIQHAEQFWHAGLIGFFLGMGGTAKEIGFKSSLENVGLLDQLRAQNAFYSDVASRLTKAGSPQTAKTVRQMIADTNRRAAAIRERSNSTEQAREDAVARRVPSDRALPDRYLFNEDGQAEMPFNDPRRGTAIGEFPAGEQQAEFNFADPRRSPNDPAQLEFDFSKPPPNVDENGQMMLPGFDADAAVQAELDFDTKPDTGTEQKAPAGPNEAVEPFLPGLDPEREQASLDFDGADEQAPPPLPAPEPGTIRDLVGRRASYGGYTGTVTIDPETGEAVLSLSEPTETGATEVLLGSPNNSAKALSFQNRLAVLESESNGFPVGTPYVRFGRHRYALPRDPNIQTLTDADGNPTGLIIRNAQRIEGGVADIEIRTKEKATEILRYYGLTYAGLAPATEADASMSEIQAELNLNPDANPSAQVESMVPPAIKPTLDSALDLLDTEIVVNGTNYNLLEALDLIADGRLRDKAYLESLADLPMEVFDALRTRIEKAFDIVAAADTAPEEQRTALAETLIQLHAKLESRERAYLNYYERRIATESRNAAKRAIAEQRGGTPSGPEAPAAPAAPAPKSGPVGPDDEVSTPASEAAPEEPRIVQLELDFNAAPETTPVPDGDGGQTTLLELQQGELALNDIRSDPKRRKVEKEVALRALAKNKKAQKEASKIVKAKQAGIAKQIELEFKATKPPIEPSAKEKKKQEAKEKANQIKKGNPKASLRDDVKTVKLTPELSVSIGETLLTQGPESSASFVRGDAKRKKRLIERTAEQHDVPVAVVQKVFSYLKGELDSKGVNLNQMSPMELRAFTEMVYGVKATGNIPGYGETDAATTAQIEKVKGMRKLLSPGEFASAVRNILGRMGVMKNNPALGVGQEFTGTVPTGQQDGDHNFEQVSEDEQASAAAAVAKKPEAPKEPKPPKEPKKKIVDPNTAEPTVTKAKDFDETGTWEVTFPFTKKVYRIYYDRSIFNAWLDSDATEQERFAMQDRLGWNKFEAIEAIRAKAIFEMEQSEEVDASKLKEGQFRTMGERDMFRNLASNGYLYRDLPAVGFPRKGKGAATYLKNKADELEAEVFRRYPKVAPSEADMKDPVKSSATYRYAGQKVARIDIPVQRDEFGEVLRSTFTNDPRVTAEALKKGFSVIIPKKLRDAHADPDNDFNVNPTIDFDPRTGEVKGVLLDPAGDPIVPGFAKQVTTPYEVRSLKETNSLVNALADIWKAEDREQMQKLQSHLFPAGGGSKFDNAVRTKLTPTPLAEHSVEGIKNLVYMQSHLRMQEKEIALDIQKALLAARQRKEGASLDDINIPNIVRRHAKSDNGEKRLVEVVRRAYDVRGTKGHKASDEVVLTVYGKALYEQLKAGGRFPGGRVPDPMAIAKTFVRNFQAAEVARQERATVSMEAEGVATAVESQSAHAAVEAYRQIESEHDVVARNRMLHDSLVLLMDSDSALRFHFDTMAIRAGYPNAPQLPSWAVIDALKGYVMTADFDTQALMFERNLAQTKAGQAAAALLVEAGIMPINSLRSGLTAAQMKAVEEAIVVLNSRLAILEQYSYDSAAVDRNEITKASLASNNAALEVLGIKANNPESVINALQMIAKGKAYSSVANREIMMLQREVAKLLLTNPELIADVKIDFIEAPQENFAGRYYADSNLILINLARSNGRGLIDVLLHEYLHAATISMIVNPRNAQQRAALKRMDSLRQYALAQATKAGFMNDPDFVDLYQDAFANNAEFLTYMLTDARFQSLLQNVSEPRQRSFLRRVADAILKFFGINVNDADTSLKEQAITELLDFTRMSLVNTDLFGRTPARAERETRSLLRKDRAMLAPVAETLRFRERVGGTTYNSTANEVPQSAVNVLYNDSTDLPKPSSKRTNSDVAAAIAVVASDFWGRTITSQDITPAEFERIAEMGVAEFIAALESSDRNASDWYSTSIEVAMAVAGVIHPELVNADVAAKSPGFASHEDPQQAADLAMRMALAITSQNLTVQLNTRYAEEQFQIFKETGRFDPSKIYGEKAKSISGNLSLANNLIAEVGFKKTEEIIREEFTVKELKTLAENLLGQKVNIVGKVDDIVNGASLFGPKIGQGFLQNVMGKFDPVTIDLWMRRTWGRWTGDVVGIGVKAETLAKLLDRARDAGINLGVLKTLRVVERKRKSGNAYRTVSEPIQERLETDEGFIKDIVRVAEEIDAMGQRHYALLKANVTPEVKAKVESGQMGYDEFIRNQEKTKQLYERAFAKEQIRRRGKGSPVIKKETFVKEWLKSNGYTEKVTDAGRMKQPWAQIASTIVKSLDPIDVPSAQDRRVITALVNTIREKLAERGYTATNADVQAVLWYPEKDLWSKLRGENEHNLNNSYDTEFKKIATERGLASQAASAEQAVLNRRDRAARTDGTDGRPAAEGLRSGSREPAGREEGTARSASRSRGSLATSLGYDTLSNPYDQSVDVTEEVRGSIPPGFRVVEDFEGPAAYYDPATPGVIYVNPVRMASAIDGMGVDNARATIQSVINEEIAHAAGLDTLTEEDLVAFESKLNDADYRRFLDEYADGVPESERDAFIAKWERKLEQDPATAKRQLVHEHLRMQLQKVTTGSTTETDVAFYRRNPSNWAVAFRYLKAAFSKLLQRVRMSFDPQTAAMVNRMIREVRRLNSGGRFMDNVARMSDGNVDEVFTKLDAVLASSVGSNITFDDILKVFDLPVALAQGTGQYDPGKTINKRFRKSGDIDPRLYEINEVRVQIMRMIGSRMDAYGARFEAMVKKHYGSKDQAPMDHIQRAFGTTAPLLLKADYDAAEARYDAVLNQIEADGLVRLAAAEAERQNGNRQLARQMERTWYAERTSRIEQAAKDKQARLDRRADAASRAHKRDSIVALQSLPQDLADLIKQMRGEIDAFSGKVQQLDGRMSSQLSAVFDRNKGIYITRSYRIFTEEGFSEKMLNDPAYAGVRDAAAKFFEHQLIKQFADQFLKEDAAQAKASGTAPTLTPANARIRAQAHVTANNLDQKAVEGFLAHYDGDPKGFLKGDKTFKLDVARFMHKGDVPLELRELMGEETDPFKNAFRTYANVGFLAANQFALNEFTRVGKASGFLVDAAAVAADPSKYAGYRVIKPKGNTAYAPLAGMFAPPELIHAMDAMFGAVHKLPQTSSKDTIDKTLEVAARLTGLSLGMKTLGSVGFFIRNMLSNVLFFGPMQGYVLTPGRAMSGARTALKQRQTKGNLDNYVSHLVSLGVIGDDVRSSVLNDMLRGHAEDPAMMQKNINSMAEKLFKQGNALAKVGHSATAGLFQQLQKLNVAIDAFHKVGLYEFELSILRKAYPHKPEKELEQLAADKVKMTAQSYSQAPPIVRDFTRSGLGLLIAPFARFKGEVFRVGINTVRLGLEEIKSGNSVIRMRGIQRLSGFGTVIAGFSVALPYVLAAAAGLGDDEEEAIRASLPEYARNNTFFFWRDADGKLWQTDLTYTNPFALVMDPLMRSMEAINRGDMDRIADIWWTTMTDTMFGEQIAAGTYSSLRKNYDEQRGMPIYSEADTPWQKTVAATEYMLTKAFEPRMLEKARQMWSVSGMPDTVDVDGMPLTGYEGAWQIFADEFKPSKVRQIKPNELSQRFIRDKARIYSEVRNQLGEMKSSRPFSDADVARIYNDNVEKRIRLFNEVRRVQRGFEKLGVSKSQFAQSMVASRFSKGRVEGVLWGGLLDRPVPTKDVINVILDNAPDGRRRIEAYYDAVRKTDRWLKLD